MTNRFIKTYQRMNGPLQDYYYAQELKKLPKIEYKVNVYFSGVMKDYMQSVYNTELSGKKITNPMDVSELAKDTLSYPTHVVQMYSDLPKIPSEGEINDFWFIIETKKIYSWIPSKNLWADMTSDGIEIFKIVYIGDDKSQIGTKDIELNFEDYGIKGDGGSYFIYYLSSDVPLRTNSIYKVLDTKNSTLLNINKTFVYGNEFEHLSNWSDVEERVNQIYNLIKDDIPSSISEDEVTVYVMYSILTGFFGSVDVINNEGNLNQKFKILAENNKYIIDISFKQTENNVETTLLELYKEFDSVEELGKYILSDDYKLVVEGEADLAQASREFLKQCNITPKYSNESLPDLQNEPINAVMSSEYSQKVFNFYFYTGKEFIQGGGGSDTSKEIIEKDVNLNTEKFTTALTIDEFNKLKNNEAIIKITITYFDVIPLDLYGDNPSVINGISIGGNCDVLVYAIPNPLIDTPAVYILSIQSNTLDSFSIKIIEVNEPVLGNSPTTTYSAISTYPLLGFSSGEADILQLHMSNGIYIGKFTYDSTGSSYVFYEGSDSKHAYFVSKLTGIIGLENDDKNYASFEIVLKLNEKNPNSSAIIDKYYSCIIHISSITSNASEGTFTIYDTTTNKITYVILRIHANSYASPMFEMDYLKAFQDGVEITSNFVSKISEIYLNLL